MIRRFCLKSTFGQFCPITRLMSHFRAPPVLEVVGSTAAGTDLSVHSSENLDWVAAELSDRPRKRLALKKRIEQIKLLLLR
jgi:hypothetical protein